MTTTVSPPPSPDDPRFQDWLFRLYTRVLEGSSGTTTGTWTPVLTFATPGDLSVTYQFQFGDWSLTGTDLTLIGFIQTSAFTFTTASGELRITGIPNNCDTSRTGMTWSGSASWQGITKAGYGQIVPQISTTVTSALRMIASGSGSALSAVAAADMPSGGTVSIRFRVSYKIA